ncbi:secondary thiamine-phosphate synthase enzyme YjbQ [Bacteriovoracaceae bacterium]|nr:secondary thiamine-phosphate synthase enzyme YjbQ [Bacteriovoracaceae bacterium]
MAYIKYICKTNGEGFYDITQNLLRTAQNDLFVDQKESGVLVLFCMHTSCGLVLNESYDPSAKDDLERFLKEIAPRNLKWITHTAEGPDDSPSHMKALLVQSSMSLIVEDGKPMLGQWQGIFLTEFREESRERTILMKFMKD